MIIGIFYAITACFIWGLTFIVPTYMQGFNPFEIALGRHFIFGIISSFFFMTHLKKFSGYHWKIWGTALGFAFLTNITCYSCIVTGVTCASTSVTALFFGISPIVIPFYANWLEQECNYKDFFIPTILIAIGLILVNFSAFQNYQPDEKPFYLWGILAGIGALGGWSWYVVHNARFLKKHPEMTSDRWTTIIGTATFFWVLTLGFSYEIVQGKDAWQKLTTLTPNLYSFVLGALILGILCSWVGSFLWNKASIRLPIALTGQLTVFETIFGLLFFYLLEWQIPPFYEILGVFLILSAISYATMLLTKQTTIIKELIN